MEYVYSKNANANRKKNEKRVFVFESKCTSQINSLLSLPLRIYMPAFQYQDWVIKKSVLGFKLQDKKKDKPANAANKRIKSKKQGRKKKEKKKKPALNP